MTCLDICTANLFELVLISLLTKDPTIRARILNKVKKTHRLLCVL